MRGLVSVILFVLLATALPTSATSTDPVAEQPYLYSRLPTEQADLPPDWGRLPLVCHVPVLHLNGACFDADVFTATGTYRFEVVDDSGQAIGFRVQPWVNGPIQPFQPYDGCGTFTLDMTYYDLDRVTVSLHAPSEECRGTPTTGVVQVSLE